jgi:tetratricopeptide (TPR) repeat protein
VTSRTRTFEQVSEFIEDRVYAEGENGSVNRTVQQLSRLARFLESERESAGEGRRRLADVYIMLGELNFYHERVRESTEWFHKAIAADDSYAAPYHSLALANMRLGDHEAAARHLEQEIAVAPGNYYSYLMLADLYEGLRDFQRFEDVLHRLLGRDPDNIQALHRLILHYEKTQPEADVGLLRRRIVSLERDFNKVEMIIWTYHMCREQRCEDVLDRLARREKESPDSAIIHLLKAAAYGEMRQFSRKKRELARFKHIISGSQSSMQNELKEFEEVFGHAAVAKLSRRLAISSPSTHGI